MKPVAIAVFAMYGLFATSCSNSHVIAQSNAHQLTAKPSPEWSELLRRNEGWLGADGTYSIPLNGIETSGKEHQGKTMFLFSDGVVGKIENDTLRQGCRFLHNSVAYLDGDKPSADHIHFYYKKDSAGNALSMFEPHTPNSKSGDYYWMGDGFINPAMDSTLYLFAYRIRNTSGSIYPFDDVGLSLISIPKNDAPPFVHQQQLEVPFFLKDSKGKGKVVFGISILPNTVGAGALRPDGYIYIYGIRGIGKELLVARVKDTQFENFDQWRFWDGSDWNKDINSAASLTNRVSNEMSVSLLDDGRVVAVYQQDTDSPNVMMQVSMHPWGPFQPPKKVWETPEIYDGIDYYTYNAKAHSNLSKPGELLISYNVNSFQFDEDLKAHPDFYHSRFITIKLQP